MKLSNFILIIILIIGTIWEIFAFLNFPQQAWVQGLVESWFVSKGLFFYKDFAGTYLPLLRMLMVPYHVVFGFTQEATIFLAPATAIATMLILFWASIKYLSSWYKFFPLIFFVLWNQFIGENHFTTAAFLGILVLMTVILWWEFYQNPQHIKAFFLGLLSIFCVLTLQLMASFVSVILLSTMFKIIRNRNWRRILIFYLIGFLTPSILVLAIITLNQALPDFYYWTIIYHLTSYPYDSFGKSLRDTLTFVSIHSPLVLLGLGGYYALFKKDYSFSLQLFFLLLAILALAVSFWFALFHPLRFQITLPAVALIFGLSLQVASKSGLNFRLLGILVAIGILWFNFKNIYGYVLPKYEEILDNPPKRQIVSWVYVDDPMYKTASWVKQNTPEDSKIFVLGDLLFYKEAERLISSPRGASNIPMAYYQFDNFVREIKQRPPDYWVIDERNFRRFKEFGYGHLVSRFQQLLGCQEVVARFDYWTISRHTKLDSSCFNLPAGAKI